MAKAQFDSDGFWAALDAQRQSKNLTWKKVAADSGVSASTLTRMAQGKRPDIDSLAALVSWSGLSADNFVRSEGQSVEADTLAKITTYLRADENLDVKAAAVIEDLVKSAYERLRKSKE